MWCICMAQTNGSLAREASRPFGTLSINIMQLTRRLPNNAIASARRVVDVVVIVELHQPVVHKIWTHSNLLKGSPVEALCSSGCMAARMPAICSLSIGVFLHQVCAHSHMHTYTLTHAYIYTHTLTSTRCTADCSRS